VTRAGLRVEPAATNLALRSEEFENAGWTAVGTPTVTANTTEALDGTMTADTIEDDDGAASEGEQQTLATTSGAAYTLSVYAKAGTSTKLRLSNDGTTCDFAVTSEWERYTCTDASASGTSTTQQILVGHATSDTGTLVLWGAQFESGSVATSYIRTEGSTVARNAEQARITLPAGTKVLSQSARFFAPSAFRSSFHNRPMGTISFPGGKLLDHFVNSNALNCSWYDGTTTFSMVSTATLTTNAWNEVRCSWDGATMRACVNGACNSAAKSGTPWSSSGTFYVGSYASSGYEATGIVADSCIGTDPGACQ
jgi:hypothetical protein